MSRPRVRVPSPAPAPILNGAVRPDVRLACRSRARRSTVRTKSANEDEPLEPLWVDDDGVVVEPEFVAPEAAPVDAKTLARDYAAAFRAVLRERNEVRARATLERPGGRCPGQAPRRDVPFDVQPHDRSPAGAVGRHARLVARAARTMGGCASPGGSRSRNRAPRRAGRGGPVVGCAARGACGRSPSSSCSGRTSAGGRRSRSNPNGRCMSVVGTSAAGTACSTR